MSERTYSVPHDDNDYLEEFFATYTVLSRGLNPDDLTRETEILPAHTQKGVEADSGWGAWVISTREIAFPDESEWFCGDWIEAHIGYLLDLLEPHRAVLQPFIEKRLDSSIFFTLVIETNRADECIGDEVPQGIIHRMSDFCHYLDIRLEFRPRRLLSSVRSE